MTSCMGQWALGSISRKFRVTYKVLVECIYTTKLQTSFSTRVETFLRFQQNPVNSKWSLKLLPESNVCSSWCVVNGRSWERVWVLLAWKMNLPGLKASSQEFCHQKSDRDRTRTCCMFQPCRTMPPNQCWSVDNQTHVSNWEEFVTHIANRDWERMRCKINTKQAFLGNIWCEPTDLRKIAGRHPSHSPLITVYQLSSRNSA